MEETSEIQVPITIIIHEPIGTKSTCPSVPAKGRRKNLRAATQQKLDTQVADLHSVTHQSGKGDLQDIWYDDHRRVTKAKQEGMERFAGMRLYEVVLKSELACNSAVVVGSLWVVTNKGTTDKIVATARLVAHMFADHTLRGQMFVAKSNLTRVKYLLSLLCTR